MIRSNFNDVYKSLWLEYAEIEARENKRDMIIFALIVIIDFAFLLFTKNSGHGVFWFIANIAVFYWLMWVAIKDYVKAKEVIESYER